MEREWLHLFGGNGAIGNFKGFLKDQRSASKVDSVPRTTQKRIATIVSYVRVVTFFGGWIA